MSCKQCGAEETLPKRRLCRECRAFNRRNDPVEKERNRVYKETHVMDPEKYAKMLSKQSVWRYGISHSERDQLLEAQGGVCAICGTDKPLGRGWVIDHDHACCPGIKSCGKCIRGILCTKCNLMIGLASDNIETLRLAQEYLLKDADLLAGLSSSGQPNLQAGILRRTPV